MIGQQLEIACQIFLQLSLQCFWAQDLSVQLQCIPWGTSMDFVESVMWNNLPLPLFMRGSNWTLGIAAVTDANLGWVSRFRPLFPDELAQIGNERGRSCPSLSATYLHWYLILIFG